MYLRNCECRLDPARDLALTPTGRAPTRTGSASEGIMSSFGGITRRFQGSQIYVILFDLKRAPRRVVQEFTDSSGWIRISGRTSKTSYNIGGMPASPLLERLVTNSPLRSVEEPGVSKRTAHWARRLRTRAMRPVPLLPGPKSRTLALIGCPAAAAVRVLVATPRLSER